MGNAQPQTRQQAFSAAGQGSWRPTHSAVFDLIMEGAGLPKKAASGPARLAVYEAIKRNTDDALLHWEANLEQIVEACKGGVGRRLVAQAVQDLKQLGVLDYSPGARYQRNVYYLRVPSEVPALHQTRLLLEASPSVPPSSSANSALLEGFSSANSARAVVQKTAGSSADSAPKQQDSASDSVKDNNSALSVPASNVVVASLVSVGFQEHDAQAAFLKYDSAIILEAVKNTKARMQRGSKINSAAWCHDQVKRLQEAHLRAIHNAASSPSQTQQAAPVPPSATSDRKTPSLPPIVERASLRSNEPAVPLSNAERSPSTGSSAFARPPAPSACPEAKAALDGSEEASALTEILAMRARLKEEKGFRASYRDRPPVNHAERIGVDADAAQMRQDKKAACPAGGERQAAPAVLEADRLAPLLANVCQNKKEASAARPDAPICAPFAGPAWSSRAPITYPVPAFLLPVQVRAREQQTLARRE